MYINAFHLDTPQEEIFQVKKLRHGDRKAEITPIVSNKPRILNPAVSVLIITGEKSRGVDHGISSQRRGDWRTLNIRFWNSSVASLRKIISVVACRIDQKTTNLMSREQIWCYNRGKRWPWEWIEGEGKGWGRDEFGKSSLSGMAGFDSILAGTREAMRKTRSGRRNR